MGLTAVGLVALAFLDNTTPVPVLMLILAVLGIGFGLFSSPNVNAIMSSVQKKYLGIASGTLGTMRLVGQMLSMGIATMILAIYIGRTQITSSQYGQAPLGHEIRLSDLFRPLPRRYCVLSCPVRTYR